MRLTFVAYRKDTFLRNDNQTKRYYLYQRYCNINESGCRKAFNRVGTTIK